MVGCLAATASAQSAGPRVSPTVGIRGGLPLVSSVVLGAVYQASPSSGLAAEGPFIQGEAGVGGAALGVGYMTAYQGGATWWRLAVMQPWQERWRGEPRRTYLGVEGRFMIALVGAGVGAYVRVAGEEGYAIVPAISLGFGY